MTNPLAIIIDDAFLFFNYFPMTTFIWANTLDDSLFTQILDVLSYGSTNNT